MGIHTVLEAEVFQTKIHASVQAVRPSKVALPSETTIQLQYY
jgi:hypothetical protein